MENLSTNEVFETKDFLTNEDKMIEVNLSDETSTDSITNNIDQHLNNKYSLMKNMNKQKTNKKNNCISNIILPFYILFYIGEWTIFMYWLVEGLHIDKWLIIFIITNHEFLLTDYFQLSIIVNFAHNDFSFNVEQVNNKNKLTLLSKISIIVWLYKLIAVQLYYSIHVINNVQYLDNQLFKYVYLIHYVYVLLIPIVYIKYVIKLINAQML
jgi:hypothetical protein